MQAPRYLCSQLVRLQTDGREQWVNLEEIWSEGGVLECEERVKTGVSVKITADQVTLEGQVTTVTVDDLGWRVEIAFAESTPWSIEQWQPKHLLDPASIGRPAT